MHANVQRIGDQLAVAIPPALAAAAGLQEDSAVEMSLVEGKLVISSAASRITLSDLLKDITPENIHGEWDTGPAVGGEIL
ncbi:MAG: AbrB/MazE/SpoVT family DNA-binding domain-containing protein [Planctomycetia bacterium]|nr:AbrB/MazE/SpoVT family DNA-binding domain-containing protein [Planctomycetia bacterium]